MSRIRRHSPFPHHWPVHVAGSQALGLRGSAVRGSGVQGPGVCPAPAADSGVKSAAAPRPDGALAAAPWLGLHYEAEGT